MMDDYKTSSDRRRMVLRYIAIILAIITAVSAVFYALGEWEKYTNKQVEDEPVQSATIQHNGNKYVVNDAVETVLILGLDKPSSEDVESYNNSKQADFVMLLVIDNDAKTCKSIHINRDTIAQVNVLGVAGETIDVVEQQLAMAHTYGNGKEVSCRNVANSVSRLLMNVEIDHYVSIPLDAVPVFNDLVGGVKVEILDDFTAVDSSLIKGEEITLNGQQALKYIQGRQNVGDQSNVNRMARQRQYINAFYEKFREKSQNDTSFSKDFALNAVNNVISDCSANKLDGYIDKILSYEFSSISEIDGELKKGEEYMEFYPDEASLKQLVVDNFYRLK